MDVHQNSSEAPQERRGHKLVIHENAVPARERQVTTDDQLDRPFIVDLDAGLVEQFDGGGGAVDNEQTLYLRRVASFLYQVAGDPLAGQSSQAVDYDRLS